MWRMDPYLWRTSLCRRVAVSVLSSCTRAAFLCSCCTCLLTRKCVTVWLLGCWAAAPLEWMLLSVMQQAIHHSTSQGLCLIALFTEPDVLLV